MTWAGVGGHADDPSWREQRGTVRRRRRFLPALRARLARLILN